MTEWTLFSNTGTNKELIFFSSPVACLWNSAGVTPDSIQRETEGVKEGAALLIGTQAGVTLCSANYFKYIYIWSVETNSSLHLQDVRSYCVLSSSHYCYIHPLQRHRVTSVIFLLVYLASSVNKSFPAAQAWCFTWLLLVSIHHIQSAHVMPFVPWSPHYLQAGFLLNTKGEELWGVLCFFQKG